MRSVAVFVVFVVLAGCMAAPSELSRPHDGCEERVRALSVGETCISTSLSCDVGQRLEMRALGSTVVGICRCSPDAGMPDAS